MRGWGRGLDSPFFSTIVLLKTSCFPLDSTSFLKEWGGEGGLGFP